MYHISDAEIAEAIIWQMWQDRLPGLHQPRLTDGRTVRIHEPGHLNTDSGPDFLNAELTYGPGPVLKGDVEIHIRPADWHRHGHDSDPRYDGVALHVVMWNDGHLKTVRKHNRQFIPTLVLSDHLRESLPIVKDRYRHNQIISTQHVSYPCRPVLRAIGADRAIQRIEEAGLTRFHEKAADMMARMKRVSSEQVLYEYVMRSAGYTKNATAFQDLAQRLPVAWIRACLGDLKIEQHPAAIQALLFGAAGLLPSQRLRRLSSQENHPYVNELEARWASWGPQLGIRTMDEKDWLFFRLRPYNFPTVRLAGMSYLIAAGLECGLDRPFTRLMENHTSPEQLIRRITDCLQTLFIPDRDDYWLTHTVFGPEKHTGRHALIGLSRQKEIAINAVFPFLFAMAAHRNQQKELHQIESAYVVFPGLTGNRIFHEMNIFLFKNNADQKVCATRAVLQQGLIQIEETACRNKTCRRCTLRKI